MPSESGNNNKKNTAIAWWHIVIAWWYSVSQGLFTGFSTFTSMVVASKNFTVSLIAGVIALIADTIASYFFQGKAIQQSDTDRKLYTEIKDPNQETALLINKDQKRETAFVPSRRSTFVSTTAQLGYMTLDASKTIANRYFLLFTLYNLFNDNENYEDNNNLTMNLISLFLLISIMIKQTFNMSNETWEATKAIAEHITHDATQEPFYHKVFLPLSKSQNSSLFFTFIGSIDHTLWDDLAPWVVLLPKEAIQYLALHKPVQYTIIALAGIIGFPLAVLVFFQTYLFEGKHTLENLKTIHFELARTNSIEIPQKVGEIFKIPLQLAKVLRATITIMSPIHGLATSVPVFVTLRNLIKNPDAKWTVSTVSGLFTLLGTAIGHYKSEVKEAKMELDETINSHPNL